MMKKWIMAFLAAAAAGAVQAKQLNSPDPNTSWMEDGTEIEAAEGTGSGQWKIFPNGREMEIKSKEDGKGFSLISPDKNGRKTATRLKFSPEYPYLVFRVTDFEVMPGYSSWTIRVGLGPMLVGQVKTPQKGIYVFDLYQNLSEKEAERNAGYLTLWLNNLRLDLESIKMVKKPGYVVRAECADPEIKPGSRVKFTAELEEAAEDVSITLVTTGVPRTIKVNGETKIQLKPADKAQKIWTAEVEIGSIDIKKSLSRFKCFMKMNVLGGALDEPVWVGLPYPIEKN